MATHGTHPVGTRENAAIRRLDVLNLRKRGYSLRAIGAQVGVSAVQASKDLQRALQDLAELQNASTLEWRQLEIERLDGYLLALEPAIASGDVRAIEAGIKLSESRRKMLGVDMPAKVAPTTPDGDEAYASPLDDLLRRLTAPDAGNGVTSTSGPVFPATTGGTPG